ncbi:hypothetical protein Halhy_0513 [Haliscomenobacter hydrossis DSM 1100]|uniref:Uncharacterized protein n=1 Tax=Haliscomenobacter hydrossis (strain ATCC 27775 / DSM 1100 / LMG 10767 / O) TaxID=760192 RepID=F4KZC8_HALH1|nr:hypothetical protein Halhy_0513 [Haliscomenobacter hydrossis DSM 1100]
MFLFFVFIKFWLMATVQIGLQVTFGGFAFGRDFYHKNSYEAQMFIKPQKRQTKHETPPDAKPLL